MRTHLEPLRQVVVERFALDSDERLAINVNSIHDADFMRDLLPLLATSPRRNRAIAVRHEKWCIALKKGEYDGFSFSELDEARIGAACNAVRNAVYAGVDSGVSQFVHSKRVNDLWNAVVAARLHRAKTLSTTR